MLLAYQGFERGVATFYDLPGIPCCHLEIVEAYPDDKYLPSFLLRGETKGAVFHAQIATDVEGENIRVVTMYTPDAGDWDEGFRKRRTK